MKPEEKVARFLKRQQENLEKAKQFLLPSYLGKWVVQELSTTSSLDVISLSRYIDNADLSETEKSALQDFLASLNAKANNSK